MQRSYRGRVLAAGASLALAAGAIVSGSTATAAETRTHCGYGAGHSYTQANEDAYQACLTRIERENATDNGYRATGPLTPATFSQSERDGKPWYQWDFYMTLISDEGGGSGGGKPDVPDEELEEIVEGVVEPTPVPPPCWSAEAGGNCPVGNALQGAVPAYMMAGVPQTLNLYASWRPDPNGAAQPTDGTAVLNMNGKDLASAPFVDGVATFSFTPMEPGLKNVTFSGVISSGFSGQSAYVDSFEAATMVLPYDPELLEEALKNKKVEVGDTYTLEEIAQAKTALGKRLEWRVAQDSKDVCAITTTKKGEVRAKFTESGKCSIIWTDPKKDEEGKYTFKVTA